MLSHFFDKLRVGLLPLALIGLDLLVLLILWLYISILPQLQLCKQLLFFLGHRFLLEHVLDADPQPLLAGR